MLVGDSGVGKTGLGWRLARGEFKEHASTHGQQFWTISELGTKRADRTECEAVLWDLAGQPDYRLIHALLLDDVDLALILFDATNRNEALSSVDYWLKQLLRSKRPWSAILVAARSDRGAPTLTGGEIKQYCAERGIQGGYIATSASTGHGIPELIERIKVEIRWESIPATVTTVLFKRIKEYVLSLKEIAGNGDGRTLVLVTPIDLRERLQGAVTEIQFSADEMMAAVKHLETHGYVSVLRGSQGDVFILLLPELLSNTASSFVLEARRNPRGLGVLEEDRLLRGEYGFPELSKLTTDEREKLLDATASKFLEHNLCFRQTFTDRTFLVFPSLINEKRPLIGDVEIIEDISYVISGATQNVYASLVVLLGYTNTFTRTHQWQDQAQYELEPGQICGFRLVAEREGRIELVLYYGPNIPEPVMLMFQGLFERFLSRHNLAIDRVRPVVCPSCTEPLQRSVVMTMLAQRRIRVFCNSCGHQLAVPPAEEVMRYSDATENILTEQHAIATRRTAFEAGLVAVKGLLRDRGIVDGPVCFVSYAWGVPDHEKWVVRLAKDLRNAGVQVLLDRWDNALGQSINRYVDRVLTAEYVVIVGTPALRAKYESVSDDPVVSAELNLISTRLRQPNRHGRNVIPVLLDGDADTSFTPQLIDVVRLDFRDESLYFAQAFTLIWHLYRLPIDHVLFEQLTEAMRGDISA